MQNVVNLQPRPRPLLGWLWQISLAGLVNFRLAFGNYRNGHLPRKGLVDFTLYCRLYFTNTRLLLAKIEKIYINVVVYKTIFHERFYFWYIF